MRIMFKEDRVEEIMDIYVTSCWYSHEGSSYDNPKMYVVSLYRCTVRGHEEVGEYILDGTKETFEKAKANYKNICEKLLTQGWCRATDFENFLWY